MRSRPPASAVRLARRRFALPDGVALRGEESESGLFSSSLRVRFGSEAPGEPSGSRSANADPLFFEQHPSFLWRLISVGGLANVPRYQPQLSVLSVQGCGGAGSRVDGTADGLPPRSGFRGAQDCPSLPGESCLLFCRRLGHLVWHKTRCLVPVELLENGWVFQLACGCEGTKVWRCQKTFSSCHFQVFLNQVVL